MARMFSPELVALLDQGWELRVSRLRPWGERPASWSVEIFRKFCAPLTGKGDALFTHAVYAGSDDDEEDAINQAVDKVFRQQADDPRWGLRWEERTRLDFPEGSTVEQARKIVQEGNPV